MKAPEPKAMADVVVRHLCNGQPIAPDQTQRWMVHKDRRSGKYYIVIFNKRHTVERVEMQPRFILTHHGRTPGV